MKYGFIVLLTAGLILGGCQNDKADKTPAKQGDQAKTTETPVASKPATKPAGLNLPLPTAETKAIDAATVKQAGRLINGGLVYLASQVNEHGGWSIQGAFEPALTALVLKAMIQHPGITMETPMVKKGYARLLSFQQPDGAIYDPKQGRSNYCTAIAVCSLVAANDPKLKPSLDKALTYIKGLQILPGTESRDKQAKGQKITKGHPYIGGVSYGKHGRPDMNNTGWWMQAMHDAGVDANDPAMKNALSFVLRSQNRSESNDRGFAKEGSNDGGFIYAPAKRDTTVAESKAGPGMGGKGLASYGSITYVGLKSMLYAGLSKDDPRVKAAYLWVRKNWTLDQNPNMPKTRSQQGVYFYYNVFAKGLRAFGQDLVPDPKNPKIKHNWRKELIEILAKRVQKNGSWFNNADRWSEGSPVLVTAYEVLALQEVLKK